MTQIKNKIIFYVDNKEERRSSKGANQYILDTYKFPCFVLLKDNWDDYSYTTSYNIRYYKDRDNYIDFQYIKILDSKNMHTELPSKFEQLESTRFFTLGPSGFYEDLKYNFPKKYELILNALNDITYKKIQREYFIESSNDILKKGLDSLLRDSDSEKAFKNINHPDKIDTFNLLVRLLPNESKIEIPFSFRTDELHLNRMHILIGKNGSGKTQTLSQLAIGLTDKMKAVEKDISFIPEKPSFGRCFAITYSIFDSFEMPVAPGKSYMFFGVSRKNSSDMVVRCKEQIRDSVIRLREGAESSRKEFLLDALASLFSIEDMEKINAYFFSSDITELKHN